MLALLINLLCGKSNAMNSKKLFGELKRRDVCKVAAYLCGGRLIAEATVFHR